MQSHSVWAVVVTLALVYLQNTESISISYSDSDQDIDKAQLLESACRIVCSTLVHNLSLVVRKPVFCICESKDEDQLCGNRTADQRLCFRYIDTTIPLFSKSEISSF